MSPYVVTTWGPSSIAAHCEGYDQEVTSRHAVATLDEARAEADRTVTERGGTEAQQLWAKLGVDSGGTVGPLPDGTVVEVAHVQPGFLAHTLSMRTDTSERDVIAAFNAQEATR